MISYLLQSSICLAALLAIYHLLLEQERMHRFNRIFLLSALAIGLTVPVLQIDVPVPPASRLIAEPVVITNPVGMGAQRATVSGNDRQEVVPIMRSVSYGGLLTWFYVAGAILMLSRFGYNILSIIRKARNNRQVDGDPATLVLLAEDVIPHSFGRFIFLNGTAYLQQKLDKQVLLHELAHVRQNHTADILAIEFLNCVFWFNPLFVFYKRAIQLNHEFLADESVLGQSPDVRSYQQVLLNAAGFKSPPLASQLNYSLTKKRLIMMKKQTSRMKIIARAGFLVPVIVLLAVLFSNRGVAQKVEPASDIKAATVNKKINPNLFLTWSEGKKVMHKRFADMTAAERAYFQPSAAQLQEWQDKSKFVVRHDDALIENSELKNYQPGDFILCQVAKSKDGKITHVRLTTENYLSAPAVVKRVMPSTKAFFGADKQSIAYARKLAGAQSD